MNRRMRTRMSGGVRGGGLSPLPTRLDEILDFSIAKLRKVRSNINPKRDCKPTTVHLMLQLRTIDQANKFRHRR